LEKKKMKFNITEKHLENSGRSKQEKGEKPKKPWNARRSKVRLEQNEIGEWFVVIADGNPLPATDVEVSIWLELQEVKNAQQ
jgi:hypothetical protein